MTTELTKAAQQALEQLEFLNACYPHKTAADAIASLQSALTQRPAAQTEREAFEAWFDDYYDKACAEFGGIDCTDPKGIAEAAWQARASLPTPQQATPEPVVDVRCEGCGYMTHHREHMGCVRAAKQLTRPAPGVPEGWRDAFDLAAQMLTWGRDEGLTPEQVNEVDAHAKLMFAMLAAQAKGADK